MNNKNDDWDAYLGETLTDPAKAAEYLTACLEEGPEVFYLPFVMLPRHTAE